MMKTLSGTLQCNGVAIHPIWVDSMSPLVPQSLLFTRYSITCSGKCQGKASVVLCNNLYIPAAVTPGMQSEGLPQSCPAPPIK